MKIFYIAEINIPNNSAHVQHVMKMCDEFAKNYQTILFVISKNSNYSFAQIKKDYLLRNNFKIIPLSRNFILNSFVNRIRFYFFVKKNLIFSDDLIISRSVVSSLILSILGIFNFLEIHNNLSGATKYLFKLFNFLDLNKKIFFIFIHKNLSKLFNVNKKYLILDDSVKIEDFYKKNNNDTFYCTYVGSLYRGKGLEIIEYLAKEFHHINFHVFGSLDTVYLKKKERILHKNIIFHGFLPYYKIPSILMNSKILLMPYLEKVYVRSSNLEVSKFMSPLKLFEYLASGKIILASKLSVYSHILKHNYNSILASPSDYYDWKNKFNKIISDISHYSYLKKNALYTAKKYTWKKRTDVIIKKYKEINFKKL
jgi:glycosyltransferase involved in cell wall biosynthesis